MSSLNLQSIPDRLRAIYKTSSEDGSYELLYCGLIQLQFLRNHINESSKNIDERALPEEVKLCLRILDLIDELVASLQLRIDGLQFKIRMASMQMHVRSGLSPASTLTGIRTAVQDNDQRKALADACIENSYAELDKFLMFTKIGRA